MAQIYDIEANRTVIKSAQFDAVICCSKLIVIFVVFVTFLPFAVTNLYFAYTDDSCINLPAGRLIITLKDYLMVDGFYNLSYCVYVVIFVTIKNIHDKENLKNDMIWQIISFITNAFVLAWTISGAIIFWRLMDNSKCTDSLYNYMYALLIIKLALLFMDIMGRRNKDKQKVNAIY